MSKKFPSAPKNPERICWGCDAYCPARDMRCGNGSDRTPHPAELFGEDWESWGRVPAPDGCAERADPAATAESSCAAHAAPDADGATA